MIDIPVGKALAAVKSRKRRYQCMGCFFEQFRSNGDCNVPMLECQDFAREDGKNVIFKLVDYKGDGKC